MFDYYKLLGWDSFSEKYFEYVKKNILSNKSIFTHHDLACWSWNFVNRMREYGIESSWSNISHDQIEIASARYGDAWFSIKDMTDFSLDKKVDIITCNNDAINHLYSIKEWEKVFKKSYNNLNKVWYFLFDYHTLYKINNVDYSSGEMDTTDYSINYFEASIWNNFYHSVGKIISKKDLNVKMILKSYHTSFEDTKIINGLLQAWFKKYVTLGLSSKNRVYILAFKY